MDRNPEIRELLKKLFGKQRLAVLATSLTDAPGTYTSLVGFAATEDLSRLVFATMRGTRKHANMLACPQVSLLIDSRTNRAQDFQEAEAVTVLGSAREMQGPERDALQAVFLAANPHMEDFVCAPDCALMCVEVARYYHVCRFQQVTELRV
jgi:nitroimidazol reductase NimA-like FMN-containing flavoprotein (pyridoxamine 5'-phosphate oxidase superfamily)